MSDQLCDQSMDQSEEPIQTEPQDLSVKRPRNEEPHDESEHTVSTDTDNSGATIVERRLDNQTKSDQTLVNSEPNNRRLHAVIDFITSQYEQKLFWDDLLEQSQKTDNLDIIKEELTIQMADVQELIDAKDKAKPMANCDDDLRHLLTKLKFVNELYEGYIRKTKTQINNYKMQDFQKEWDNLATRWLIWPLL